MSTPSASALQVPSEETPQASSSSAERPIAPQVSPDEAPPPQVRIGTRMPNVATRAFKNFAFVSPQNVVIPQGLGHGRDPVGVSSSERGVGRGRGRGRGRGWGRGRGIATPVGPVINLGDGEVIGTPYEWHDNDDTRMEENDDRCFPEHELPDIGCSVVDLFERFVDPEMLKMIAKCSNEYYVQGHTKTPGIECYCKRTSGSHRYHDCLWLQYPAGQGWVFGK